MDWITIACVQKTNLMSGTGYACAWHNSAKLECRLFWKDELFRSVENAGAFDPTGSVKWNSILIYLEKAITYMTRAIA